MKILTPIFCALTLFTTAPLLRAQEAAVKLVAKLGSRNYAEREQAAKALEELGKAALPALAKAIENSDLETKRRAIALMEKVEEKILRTNLVEATPIRLRFENARLDHALKQIESQMALPIGLPPRMDTVSVDTTVVPYWKAWAKFRHAANLHEADSARAAAFLIALTDDDITELRRMGNGLLRIDATPRLEFAGPDPPPRWVEDDSRSVRVRVRWLGRDMSERTHVILGMEVRAEPRLEIVSLPRAEISKIIDFAGIERRIQVRRLFKETAQQDVNDLGLAYVGEIQYGGFFQQKSLAWTGPLCSLKEVHGRVVMNVRAHQPLIEIPNLLRAAGQEARAPQGTALKIHKVSRSIAGLQMALHIDNIQSFKPATPAEEIIRIRPGVIALRGPMDVVLERTAVIDSNGRKCPLLEQNYREVETGKGYEVNLTFALPERGAGPEDLRLVITKAPRVIPLEVPFVVRDVVWNEK